MPLCLKICENGAIFLCTSYKYSTHSHQLVMSTQRYGISMTVNFMESTRKGNNIEVEAGCTIGGRCKIQFDFDIPEGANKKELRAFSDDVLSGSAFITIGDTHIYYNYYPSEVVFIINGKNYIILKHDCTPECIREALSDMFMSDEEESESEESQPKIPVARINKKPIVKVVKK